MNYVDQLVLTGQDATQNYFDIIMGPVAGLGFEQFNIRAQSFTIPGSGTPTYERRYKSQKILLNSAEVELEQTFSISFIVDEFYLEYKKFVQWKNLIRNTALGTSVPLNTLKTQTTVQGKSSLDIPVQIWNFAGVRVQSVGDVSFDRGSGEALSVDITFAFDKLVEL